MKNSNWILILLILILLGAGLILIKLYTIEEKVTRTNKFVFEVMQDASIRELRTIQPLDLTIGSAESSGTIIMYTDLSCSHCDEFFATTFREINTALIETGKARFIIRFLVNPNDSTDVHNTVEAFCGMDSTYNTTRQSEISNERSEFEHCRTSGAIRNYIVENSRKARQAGISLTPSFIVNGVEIAGNRKFAKFEELLSNNQAIGH